MQRIGLENTGLFNVINVGTCDTDINAIIAGAAINDGLTNELIESYPNYPDRQTMADELKEMHIGYDFVKDKEYDWNKVAKSKDSKNILKKTWLGSKLSKNVGDIARVGLIPPCDMISFSFPCQSLSVAGSQEGIKFEEKEDGTKVALTRSGLVWEVVRILKNLKNNEMEMPKFLLMENVDALINKKNIGNYELLNQVFKEELGYDVKYAILNAKFCGVPQNRARVFGVYYLEDIDISSFEFPLKFDSGIRLKDILEEKVDDKYYITNPKAQDLIDQLVKDGKLTEKDLEN